MSQSVIITGDFSQYYFDDYYADLNVVSVFDVGDPIPPDWVVCSWNVSLFDDDGQFIDEYISSSGSFEMNVVFPNVTISQYEYVIVDVLVKYSPINDCINTYFYSSETVTFECSSCPDNLVVNHNILGVQNESCRASQSILTTSYIDNNSDFTFGASTVVMLEGFHAQAGADLLIEVNPCGGLKSEKVTNDSYMNKRVKSLSVESVGLYPNPASSQVNIDVPDKFLGSELVLVNSLGHKVYSKKLLANKEVFYVSDFNDGIYFVRVLSLDGQILFSEKLIVK